MGTDIFNLPGGDKDQSSSQQINILTQLAGSGQSPVQIIQMLGPVALPVVEELLKDDSKAQIKATCDKIHSSLGEGALSALDPMQVAMAQVMLASIGREEIKKNITQRLAATSAEQMEQKIDGTKSLVNATSEEQQIAIYKGIYSMLPKSAKAFFNKVSQRGRKHLKTMVKEERALITKNSDEQLVKMLEKRIEGFPTDIATDAIENVISKLDLEKVANIATDIKQKVSADDLYDVAINGLELSRDVLIAAAKGDIFKLDDTTNASAFTKSFNKVAQGIEDAVIAAGLTPDNADELADAIGNSIKASKAGLKLK